MTKDPIRIERITWNSRPPDGNSWLVHKLSLGDLIREYQNKLDNRNEYLHSITVGQQGRDILENTPWYARSMDDGSLGWLNTGFVPIHTQFNGQLPVSVRTGLPVWRRDVYNGLDVKSNEIYLIGEGSLTVITIENYPPTDNIQSIPKNSENLQFQSTVTADVHKRNLDFIKTLEAGVGSYVGKKKKVKMTWEWNWPHLPMGGNTTWFEVHISTSNSGDHSPGVWFVLCICNLYLIDCGYYNTYHEDDHER